ncbi:filamentous hemagglutinin N-terminal domain-containing protein [Brasilonema sp. UFV-L1]|uniref:two-partner secretion domain-containing protein n=1 Tax=Brasilonema sp. UFV-L1 TaxID=2234130 RepID=UPI00145F3C14|nr:filamentous hemagglutinin N-terminal domain-containing protein [Brasilonema sp. UFV-L1]NMG09695.1 filamentous hemagglutinin [Brasilonema sp. UFV-L1]
MSGFGSIRWGALLGITLGGAYALSANCALAQITPDGTLPNNSNVQTEGNTSTITGGTQAGANLFHSFKEFSVRAGDTAFFNNAVDIQNIISRVTGSSISNINGLIKANGTANLFLINPNGIIFGQNARLDINGSFVATTANALAFGNQGFFSATNPNTPELLTINPSAFLFNQIRAASIQNNSIADSGLNPSSAFTARGLRVPDSKSLLLVGGDINIDGGGLFAFGGRVELGGLRSAGTVGLNGDGNNLNLSFPDSVERSDVFLSNGARVQVIAGNGGSIAVNARNLAMTSESHLLAGIGLGSNNSKAGNIEVNATGAINLDNGSSIANQVRPKANGQGGDVNISASTLQVESEAQVGTGTFGAGNGGNLTVKADSVQAIGRSADGRVASGLFTQADRGSTGDAGDLRINTRELLVRDEAQISAGTSGAGKGGILTVKADSVQVIGRSDGQYGSSLVTQADRGTTGAAGDLTINTGELLIQNGQVSAATFGGGKGGNLTVIADKVLLIGTSTGGQFSTGLVAGTQGTGKAGNLTITTQQLLISDGALITVSSLGEGVAGDLGITANSVRLDNGEITAQTRSGNGGNLKLNVANLLLLRRGSKISTTAGTDQKGGDGGNITINTPSGFIVAVPNENSDITANAYTGIGGRVDINAFGIYGIQPRENETSLSDITASSEFGIDGTIELNTPEIDPDSGLVNLPTVPVDTEVAQGCNSPNYAKSSFIYTGRGGLPPNPKDILTPDAVQVDWVSLNPNIDNSKSPSVSTLTNPAPEPIVEATGWVFNAKGEVVFTADAHNTTPRSSWQTPTGC